MGLSSSAIAALPSSLRQPFSAAFAPTAAVRDVIGAMSALEQLLPSADGVAVFTTMYNQVTRDIDVALAQTTNPPFGDPAFMAEFDIRFARLFLVAVADELRGRRPNPAWRPLFEARDADCYPLQFALAGMNAHIEHDLAVALVQTCLARRRSLRSPGVRRDYEAINDLLAALEPGIRRAFLDDMGRRVDDHIGPAVHLISAWQIDKARDVAWASAETMWALRNTRFAGALYADGLAHSVGMASRLLLTPIRL